MKLYKCENDHEFEAEDEYGECPECGSTYYQEIKSSPFGISAIIQWINENKLIAGAILVVICLLLISLFSGDDGEAEKRYGIEIEQNGNALEFNIIIYNIDENGQVVPNETKSENFLAYPDKFEEYANAYQFKDKNGRLLKFDGNKFYPCSLPMLVEWQNSNKFPLKVSTFTSKIVDGIITEINPNAICPKQLFITNLQNSNCQLKVFTNLDNDKDVKLYTSISGREGKYSTKKIFEIEPGNSYNIFCFYKIESSGFISDTIPYEKEKNIVARGCEMISPEQIEKWKKWVADIINSWGADPNNSKQLKALNEPRNKTFINENTIVIYDGNQIDFDSFKQRAYKDSRNDIKLRFKLKGKIEHDNSKKREFIITKFEVEKYYE